MVYAAWILSLHSNICLQYLMSTHSIKPRDDYDIIIYDHTIDKKYNLYQINYENNYIVTSSKLELLPTRSGNMSLVLSIEDDTMMKRHSTIMKEIGIKTSTNSVHIVLSEDFQAFLPDIGEVVLKIIGERYKL
jgi:hypothetical protein